MQYNNPYLENYITSINKIVHQNEYLTIRDINSRYLYATQKALSMLGYKIIRGLLGKDVSEIRANISQIYKQFFALDSVCAANKQPAYAIGLLHFHEKNLHVYSVTVYPILDNEQNLVGYKDVIYRHYNISSFLKNSFDKLIDNSVSYDKNYYQLTDKEYLIIFFLVHGFNVKQISNFISNNNGSKSISTVRNIIDRQLYRKFNVIGLNQLIDKACYLKIFDEKFPATLIKYQFLQIMSPHTSVPN